MAKVIDINTLKKNQQPKIRYIITIGEGEKAAYAVSELTPGTTTIMITARTPEEAELIRKESTTIVKQGKTS